ncbi:MAG: radical SAM protein [Deltaproteobacteria bacterium]|nr:radical SAM protein [Deltaproteobacteria bacterium]
MTRNCPWNRCTFCPVYKGAKFSLRDVADVKADISAMARLAERIAPLMGPEGEVTEPLLQLLRDEARNEAVQVVRFLASGGETAFLQDANSLIMAVKDLVEVLTHLRQTLPSIRRVTTYARAHTVTKRSLAELTEIREAGLDRIHIGLESGSDEVLALVEKGATAERHIAAGKAAKDAGLELSEYVMPGLGGRALSEVHATETARVLRAIDPHFVRLRTLAIAHGSPLAAQRDRGEFEPLDDVEVVQELRTLVAGFTGMTSTVTSDHALNLLEEIDGKLPEAHAGMLATIDRFLAFDPDDQDLFIVARRFGLLRQLTDLDDPDVRQRAEAALVQFKQRMPGPVAKSIREAMARLV